MGLISHISTFWSKASLPEQTQQTPLKGLSVENKSEDLDHSDEWFILCNDTKNSPLEPLEGWELIDAPPEPEIDDDFVDIGNIAKAGASDVYRESQMSAYAPGSDAINTEMQKRLSASEHEQDPAVFLQFVANNTNPHMLRFAWNNLVTAVKECIAEMSLKPATQKGLRLNCVHCAKAADLTLHSVYEGEGSQQQRAMLMEVREGRPGIINQEFDHVQVLQLHGNHNYLDELKLILQPGERACITVPVTGAGDAYKHAMNMINLGPRDTGGDDRIFILCPQSGRVFNLHNEADVSAFYGRYTKDSPLNDVDIKYVITSGKSGEAEKTIESMGFVA